jgi:hypothetical protein
LAISDLGVEQFITGLMVIAITPVWRGLLKSSSKVFLDYSFLGTENNIMTIYKILILKSLMSIIARTLSSGGICIRFCIALLCCFSRLQESHKY